LRRLGRHGSHRVLRICPGSLIEDAIAHPLADCNRRE
jgi:hypothetical protein